MRHAAKTFCLMILLMLVAIDVAARDPTDQLRSIEHERLRSLVDADMTVVRGYHADDFELINPDGGTMSKNKYLGRIADGSLDYLVWEPEEIRVKLYRNSAVLRYRAHLRVSVNGSAARDIHFWHTDL